MTDSYNYGNINLAADPGDNFLELGFSGQGTDPNFLAVLGSTVPATIVGDAFTYTPSLTEGDSIIINKTGLYQINLTVTNGAAAALAISISRGASPGSLGLAPGAFGGAQNNIAFNNVTLALTGTGVSYQLSATIYVSQADLAQPTPTPINPARIIRALATPSSTINSNSRLFIRAI